MPPSAELTHRDINQRFREYPLLLVNRRDEIELGSQRGKPDMITGQQWERPGQIKQYYDCCKNMGNAQLRVKCVCGVGVGLGDVNHTW